MRPRRASLGKRVWIAAGLLVLLLGCSSRLQTLTLPAEDGDRETAGESPDGEVLESDAEREAVFGDGEPYDAERESERDGEPEAESPSADGDTS